MLLGYEYKQMRQEAMDKNAFEELSTLCEDEKLAEVLRAMLSPDVDARPSASQIRSLPWLTEFCQEDLNDFVEQILPSEFLSFP